VQFLVCFRSFTEKYCCIKSEMLQLLCLSTCKYYSVCQFVFMSCHDIKINNFKKNSAASRPYFLSAAAGSTGFFFRPKLAKSPFTIIFLNFVLRGLNPILTHLATASAAGSAVLFMSMLRHTSLKSLLLLLLLLLLLFIRLVSV